MFDIGLQEMLLIGVIALLVFGPTKLPELGRMFGRAMREFRRASDEFRSTVETNLNINDLDPYPSVTPTVSTPTPTATTESTVSTVTPDVTWPPTASSTFEPVPDTTSTETANADEPGEPFVGQRGSRLVHRRDCGWVKRIPHGERVYWKRLVETRDQGLMNCPVCEPWEPS
jgi:sec-independent protein translocase protein TatA